MGWRVDAWEQPSGIAASQDAQLIWPDPRGHRLRVAVLDGVTPSPNCRRVAGVAGPIYAAAVARAALQRSDGTLEDCLLAANSHLHDAAIERSRDQAQTCVTAAGIFLDGHVDVVRAGDCEAWARTVEGWTALGTGTALEPPVVARLEEWLRDNPGAGREARHAAEETLLGRRDSWTATALGRFEQPKLQRFSAVGVHELVLASDGARLSESLLDHVPSWLGELRRWEHKRAVQARAAERVHDVVPVSDDVTVLQLVSAHAVHAVAA